MRLWHTLLLVAAVALMLTLARDPMTRVLLIVFVSGTGLFLTGLAGVMGLFQTIGALGNARTLVDHAEAIAATTVVLVVATALMSGCVFIAFWLVTTTV